MATEEAGPAQVAESLLGTAVGVRKGEDVLIESWNHTLPYATACVAEARRRGARPLLLLEDEAAYWRSLEIAPSAATWSRVGHAEWAAVEAADAYVLFPGPADRPRFNQLPPARARELSADDDEWFRRTRRAKVRVVRSLLGYASDAQAGHWGISAATWRSQLVRGTVDADPTAVHRDATSAAEKLRRGKLLRLTASNGTDVTMKLRNRAPAVEDGVVGPEDLRSGFNITVSPPGAVVVAIDEKSAEGVVIANRPSFLREGRVEGGQWEVHQGKLTNFWYTDGQSAFEAGYQAAPKGHDILSLFSIGLNGALAPGVPQVEDQEAGAVALAVGGNRFYGGTNGCSYVSWIIIGEATVAVDGKPLCDRGKIL